MAPAQNIAAFLFVGVLTASLIQTLPPVVPLVPTTPHVVERQSLEFSEGSALRDVARNDYASPIKAAYPLQRYSEQRRTSELSNAIELAWKLFECLFVVMFGASALTAVIRALPG